MNKKLTELKATLDKAEADLADARDAINAAKLARDKALEVWMQAQKQYTEALVRAELEAQS